MENKKGNTFKVLLHRSYVVEVTTTDRNKAKQVAEYFIGNPKDESNEKNKAENQFKIGSIEMSYNDASEILEQ